jgi:HK97 family phage portal protein
LKFKLFGKTFEFGADKKEIYNQTSGLPALSNEAAWINYLKGSGYVVSSDTALKIAVVIRCADVVAKTMASLGCFLFKETSTGREKAKNNSLYRLLKFMPNRETTAYEFWHMYVFNLMITRGAYAKIERDNNGFIKGIWNIPTGRVTPNRNSVTGERYIDVTYSSMSNTGILGERIYESNFMYTPGLRFADEDIPEDFIRIAGDVLGLTINLNTYAKDYFENGSNMGGFISYPQGINEEAFLKFKDDWSRAYSGVANSHKWAILEGGFTATKMDSNPQNSQALESRKFQIIEVCRMMGVPPHKVFAMETTSYNSMEQANIEYFNESIQPMNARISQTIYKDLLNTSEKKNHYANFDTKTLLKGDISARTAYYNSMRQNGIMSANDIRELEDMNDIPSEEGGNALLVNGNMISLKNAESNLPKSMQKGGNN